MRLKLKLFIASMIFAASNGNSADAQSFHYRTILEKNSDFELLEFGCKLDERLKVSYFTVNNDAIKKALATPGLVAE